MSLRTKSATAVLAVIGLAVLFLVGTGDGQGAAPPMKIRLKGSDTMLLLVQHWAEGFMASHPGVVVETTGGGTVKGMRSLISGDADIAMASRPLMPEEARLLVEKRGSLGYSVLTARDALSVYIHPENPVTDLTLVELRAIFTGEINRWSQLDGAAAPIVVVNRNPASGTRLFFGNHVLGGAAYTRRAKVVPDTAAVLATVASDPHAIGYGGVGLASGVRLCAIAGVAPSAAHVRDGSYPIARYLYLYTAVPPRGVIKEFIDWVLSVDGQAVVTRLGYVALHQTED